MSCVKRFDRFIFLSSMFETSAIILKTPIVTSFSLLSSAQTCSTKHVRVLDSVLWEGLEVV